MAGNKALENKAKVLRRHIISMLTKAGSGHTAGSLGMADVFSALYFKYLKYDSKKPNWNGRDYLFVSNGHINPVLYASLAEAEFFSVKELDNLRKINSLLQGHPHNTTTPGIENSSGPLAQGISMAVGCAVALQSDGFKNKVIAICGDGELNEGECWEAFMMASKYKLNNFTLIVDYNKIQLDGNTDDVMPFLDLRKKFESFGFLVSEMNGNDINSICKTFDKVLNLKKGPRVIIANTIPGCGVSFMEGDYHWHGKAPNYEEAKRALEELENQRFSVPSKCDLEELK